MSLNVKSVLFLIQEAVPHLEKTKGCVINTSSICSTNVNPTFLAYSLSKAALDHMTRHLAFSLGPKGIRVNTFNPGLTMTELFKDMDEESKKFLFGLHPCTWHPLHGHLSTPEEQARVCVMLASEDAGFVTGQCVKVDGGNSLMGLNWASVLKEGQQGI